jgi:hypothetical protein
MDNLGKISAFGKNISYVYSRTMPRGFSNAPLKIC